MGFATLVAVLHFGMALAAAADLRFATIFSEHAVLQRDRPLPVWGWSEPGAQVVVSFGGQEKSARADPDGRWRVTLDPMAASAEPRDLSARSQETVTVRNVLVGEVWLASGQSNMAYGLSQAVGGAAAVVAAEDPQLRFFKVEQRTAAEPQTDAAGAWQRSSPEHKRAWSAVAYYFARDLRKQLGCPVAVIQSAWGGTAAETWMSIDALRQDPPFSHCVAAFEKALARHRELERRPEVGRQYDADIARWQKEVILSEAITWRGDSTQSTNAISRNGALYENRSYAYDVRGHVLQESFTPQAGYTGTAVYKFDNATTGGLGLRTRVTLGNAVSGSTTQTYSGVGKNTAFALKHRRIDRLKRPPQPAGFNAGG